MVNFLWENIFSRDHTDRDISSILSSNYIFDSLNHNELKFVQSIVHTRTYRPGETVFSQGEVGVGMYIIVNGSVNISVEDIHATDAQKQNIFVTRLGGGDFFGEIALVEKTGRRTASAIAVDEVTLLGFFKPDLYEIIERNPRTGVKIVTRLSEVLGRRLKETSDRFSVLKRELKQMKELNK